MSTTKEIQGRCLCGAVSVTAQVAAHKFSACHCSMCRKWTGSPLLAVDDAHSVQFSGMDDIAVFDSSEWAQRGFCKHCGTHLFYRLKQVEHYALPLGLIDTDAAWEFVQQIFIDEQPAFYAFANATTQLTGAEVFAQFAPPTQ